MPARRAIRLHQLVKRRDLAAVRDYLHTEAAEREVNSFDRAGFTPLMHAVTDSNADLELIRLLIESGASVHTESQEHFGSGRSVIALALGAGRPQVIDALIEAGASLQYTRKEGYDALIDAVHGRDDLKLLTVLQRLIAHKVPLNGVTTYQESGLRVLSRLGRFDAVQLMLDAGADAAQLKWTPLMHAVATGTLNDVECVLAGDVALEATDWWERTAWLIAVQTGDLGKADLLRQRGANIHATGRCGQQPMQYAIEREHPHVLRWLIDLGLDVEQKDQFGTTPLTAAAVCGDARCVEMLLSAGANPEHIQNGETPLGQTSSAEVARLLLAAGVDPQHLSQSSRRLFLGLPDEPDEDLIDVSEEEYRRGRTRRFGVTNPERMDAPFWLAMIRAGTSAYTALQLFEEGRGANHDPVWCAQRFGQSITFLADGRIVQLGGEHEDSYDSDFCIYNDVFVHEPDGRITIFGYPEAVFPPTDFHTATLVGEHIYVIGSVGYLGSRRVGETPVYRLDTRTWAFERLKPAGEAPGWISKHRAILAGQEIEISGGGIDQDRRFVLNLERLAWRAAD